MREEEEGDERNWFSRWEEELPSPEELMPLSQTLITPNLALAFDIPTPNNPNSIPNNPNPLFTSSSLPNHPTVTTTDFDSGDLNSSGGNNSGTNNGDEPARTLKRPRLVWTPQLHKRFVDAVAHLGIKNAVPKTIMQLMSVDGLTRENVASHLQKYRLYLKRMQGLNSGSGIGVSAGDSATDQLFASGPLPHHFLRGGGGGGGGGEGSFGQFVPPMVALHQQQQQMAHAAAAAAAAAAQQQFFQSRSMGQFVGNGGASNGGFDHGFLNRGGQRVVPGFQPRMGPATYVDDLEERSGDGGGGRRVLTLFPTGED